MKIEVDANKKIIVHLEHIIDVDDLAWAVVWQLMVEKNNTPLTRVIIWKWAVVNIVEGRLYKSYKMSEAAFAYMPHARRLVDEHYPEFSQDRHSTVQSKNRPESENEKAGCIYLQRVPSGSNKLVSKFRSLPVRRSRLPKPTNR